MNNIEPRLIKKYGCAFKCRSVFRSRKKAIEHHKICWKNPSNKTCVTCIYGQYSKEEHGDDMFRMSSMVRHCNSDNELANNHFEKNLISAEFGKDLPIENCPYHTSDRKGKIELLLQE